VKFQPAQEFVIGGFAPDRDLQFVAEIAFTGWTDGGILRHPRFLGLRADKRARDVRREH
jgi:ATP-dependent DNA ligase